MSLYMRAVLAEWRDPPFEELRRFVAERGNYQVVSIREWTEFEVQDALGRTLLPVDLTTGYTAREELDELRESLEEHEGPRAACERVATHLEEAAAVIGMEVLMSAYADAVAAANTVIDFLEQAPGVLTQVDTIGWYDGADLILEERE